VRAGKQAILAFTAAPQWEDNAILEFGLKLK